MSRWSFRIPLLLAWSAGTAFAADPAKEVTQSLPLPAYATLVDLKPYLAGVDPGSAAEASLTVSSAAVGDTWTINCTTAAAGAVAAKTDRTEVVIGKALTLRKSGETTTCDLSSLQLRAAATNDARKLTVTLDAADTVVTLQGATSARISRIVTGLVRAKGKAIKDDDFDVAAGLPVPTEWLALAPPADLVAGKAITIYAETADASARVTDKSAVQRRVSVTKSTWSDALAVLVSTVQVLSPKSGSVGTGTILVTATDGEHLWELGEILVSPTLPLVTADCIDLRLHVDSFGGSLDPDNGGQARKMPVRSASHLERLGIAAGGRGSCKAALEGLQYVLRLSLGVSDATTGYPKTEDGKDNVFETAAMVFPAEPTRAKARFATVPFQAIYTKLRSNAATADKDGYDDIAASDVDGEYTLYASVDLVDPAHPDARQTVVQDQALVALVDFDPTITLAAITHPAGTGFGVVQCRDIVADDVDPSTLTDSAQLDCLERPDLDRISGALGTTPLGIQLRWSPVYHQPWFGVAAQLNASTFGLATTLDSSATALNVGNAAAGITDLASATAGLNLKLTQSDDYDPKAPEFHLGAGAALLSTVEGYKVRPFFGLSYTVILEASKNSNTTAAPTSGTTAASNAQAGGKK